MNYLQTEYYQHTNRIVYIRVFVLNKISWQIIDIFDMTARIFNTNRADIRAVETMKLRKQLKFPLEILQNIFQLE